MACPDKAIPDRQPLIHFRSGAAGLGGTQVRHLKTIILATTIGAALAPAAQAELTANIGVVSNYVFRGITQTDNGPAVQGGVDYAHDSGFFVGTWVSNVEFKETESVDVIDAAGETVTLTNETDGPAYVEVDLYAGYGGTVDELSYKAGLYYYGYPGSSSFNYLELGLSGEYQATEAFGLNTALTYIINGNAKNDLPYNGGDFSAQVGASYAFPEGWALGATYGYQWFDDADLSYPWVGASLTKDAGDFGTFGLNLSEAWGDVKYVATDSSPENLKVWVSWVKTF
jgi:uncharacterized protein (TIGR02001 family)